MNLKVVEFLESANELTTLSSQVELAGERMDILSARSAECSIAICNLCPMIIKS